MTKTGKLRFYTFLMFFSLAFPAQAAIQASVDRTEVPQDESISLKISSSGGGSLNPKFDAPDFEIMNQFENSQFSSVYVNGKFENKSEQSITYILRPKKVGTLRIRDISNNGESAPEISVQVIQENTYKKSVGSERPTLNEDNKNFFVKAEVSKSRAYKGEQIIVSYYLYRRTRVNMRDVMQYPSFPGFIREDLEMPILSSGRLDYEAVSLGGIPFERGLVARYAVYPIKEGKLKIDGFSVRADYIPKNPGNDDLLQDPFFQFFTQVTPRTGTSKSDPITVEVLPLPEEGKTPQFTGGVGEFEVSAQLDPATIKANSPLNLKVTVRGKGNSSLIEFPKVNWPKEIKFYESQGKSKNLGQGTTEKTFEIVLVPLQKGSLEIPSIEFDFFSPESRTYQRKKTAPIPIEVAEGDAGSTAPSESQIDNKPLLASTPSSFGAIRTTDQKAEGSSSFLGQPWWKWVAWVGLLVFFSFLGLMVYDYAKKRSKLRIDLLRRKQNQETFWSKLERDARELSHSNASAQQYSPILEAVVDQLHSALDEVSRLSTRAMPQRDLAKALTENDIISRDQWQIISTLFDFSEMIRFSSGGGAITDSDLHQKVLSAIHDAQKISDDILSKKLEK